MYSGIDNSAVCAIVHMTVFCRASIKWYITSKYYIMIIYQHSMVRMCSDMSSYFSYLIFRAPFSVLLDLSESCRFDLEARITVWSQFCQTSLENNLLSYDFYDLFCFDLEVKVQKVQEVQEVQKVQKYQAGTSNFNEIWYNYSMLDMPQRRRWLWPQSMSAKSPLQRQHRWHGSIQDCAYGRVMQGHCFFKVTDGHFDVNHVFIEWIGTCFLADMTFRLTALIWVRERLGWTAVAANAVAALP